jgi:hypothetical protein
MHDQSTLARHIALPRLRARSTPQLLARLAALLLLVTACAALWLTLLPARSTSVDVGTDGSLDVAYLDGHYTREWFQTRTYRWLNGDAEIRFAGGRNGNTVFVGELYSAPAPPGGALPVTLRANAVQVQLAVPETERTYRILFPPAALNGGELRIKLTSPTITPPGDSRALSVAIDRMGIRQIGGGHNAALQLVIAEMLALAALLTLLALNGLRGVALVATAIAAIALLSGLNLTARVWMAMAAWPLVGTLTVLNLASILAHRQLDRATGVLPAAEHTFWRSLWLIVLAAIGLRLVGVFTPGFEFRDLDVQALQLNRVIDGQAFLTTRSHEFGKGTTYYPSGPYLFVLPLLLVVPDLAFALHSMAAIVDGIAPLFLALLARELLMSRRAALIAAALLALLPIQFTAIWWGFYTNIAGQTLLLLFCWLLLRYSRLPSRWFALALWLSAILLLFSHIGVLLLATVSLGLGAALLWLPPRLSRQRLGQLASIGGLAVGFFAVTYLSVIVAPMLAQASSITFSDNRLTPEKLAEQRAYIRDILPVAVERAMGTILLLMLLPGLLLIWLQAKRPLARSLIVGWLATPLLFVAIEYAYLVQVRYIYFIAPLCCLASAAFLSKLGPGRAAVIVRWAIIIFVSWLGLYLWYRATALGIKPSLVPLTH